MKPEVRVNRKFLVLFISFQLILAAIIVYVMVSPKTVTVHVEKLENSYEVKTPLEITPPKIN